MDPSHSPSTPVVSSDELAKQLKRISDHLSELTTTSTLGGSLNSARARRKPTQKMKREDALPRLADEQLVRNLAALPGPSWPSEEARQTERPAAEERMQNMQKSKQKKAPPMLAGM